jgi:hypothetical protein
MQAYGRRKLKIVDIGTTSSVFVFGLQSTHSCHFEQQLVRLMEMWTRSEGRLVLILDRLSPRLSAPSIYALAGCRSKGVGMRGGRDKHTSDVQPRRRTKEAMRQRARGTATHPHPNLRHMPMAASFARHVLVRISELSSGLPDPPWSKHEIADGHTVLCNCTEARHMRHMESTPPSHHHRESTSLIDDSYQFTYLRPCSRHSSKIQQTHFIPNLESWKISRKHGSHCNRRP